jgi:hypothetical protein
MQQRLMLRGGAMRRRDRRHRFHALALPGHEQTPAIVAQWPNPVRMTDHAGKTIDITLKPRFNVPRFVETHPHPLSFSGNRLLM